MSEHSPLPVVPQTFLDGPCVVRAFGVVRVPFPEIAALRKSPGPRPASVEKIPHSLLKHADHQSLLALAAVLKAARDFQLDGPFHDWGVIASPRFLGRVGLAGPLFRFRQMGASVVSPLIIPTMSLHAVAGSLSMALKAHGFNHGVGGGPGHLAEGLMAALAARSEPGVPAVWMVATGFDPEPIPDLSGNVLNASCGYGVALALSSSNEAATGWSVRLDPDAAALVSMGPASDADGGEPLTPLLSLANALDPTTLGRPANPSTWRARVPGVGLLVVENDASRVARQGDTRRAG